MEEEYGTQFNLTTEDNFVEEFEQIEVDESQHCEAFDES